MLPATFDELNRLVGMERSLPFGQYFGEMRISDDQKRKRIDLAERLEGEFLYILSLLFYTYPQINPSVVDELRERYTNVLYDIGILDPTEVNMGLDAFGIEHEAQQRLTTMVNDFAMMTVETTMRHREDPYYYSEDRAKYLAEDQSNFIYDTKDHYDAMANGMAFKTWETVGDNRVRETHMEVEGITIPVDEPFYVGGYEMMYPHDVSLGAGAEEVCGCRCSMSYSYGE